jgi:hypothetical protein
MTSVAQRFLSRIVDEVEIHLVHHVGVAEVRIRIGERERNARARTISRGSSWDSTGADEAEPSDLISSGGGVCARCPASALPHGEVRRGPCRRQPLALAHRDGLPRRRWHDGHAR